MARQIAPVYTDGDVTASSAMRTNKCEIRCIHNAKGWARDLTPGVRAPACPLPVYPPRLSCTRLHPPSERCKSIRHAAERYIYCRCIEKQNAPSPTLRKYRGFHSSARMDGWRDETRNPLVVDFSECLRINRRNGPRRLP